MEERPQCEKQGRVKEEGSTNIVADILLWKSPRDKLLSSRPWRIDVKLKDVEGSYVMVCFLIDFISVLEEISKNEYIFGSVSAPSCAHIRLQSHKRETLDWRRRGCVCVGVFAWMILLCSVTNICSEWLQSQCMHIMCRLLSALSRWPHLHVDPTHFFFTVPNTAIQSLRRVRREFSHWKPQRVIKSPFCCCLYSPLALQLVEKALSFMLC